VNTSGSKIYEVQFTMTILPHLPKMCIFSTRQHMCYSTLYAIARPSVTWLDQSDHATFTTE